MATTKRSDLIYVDQLQEAITGAFAGRKALFGTGAAIFNTSLPSLNTDGNKLQGGDTIRVPYFDSIGELDDVAEGDALTPVKLTMSSETATVIHSGKAGELTKWAQITAQGGDPYAEYGKQFTEAWMRRIDANLITAAKTTTLVHDCSGLAGALAQINWINVIDACAKWGDELGNEQPVLMVAHSKVVADMWKLVDGQNRPLLVEPTIGELPKFRGIPVATSDRLTATATVYDVLICKRGGLVAWANGTPEVLEDRDVLANSLVTAIHTYHVAHLYKRPANGTKPGVVRLKVKAST